jgi:hydroxyacylglutathione hydrolase
MFIKQFVDEGLGNSSYLIASEASGLAAVIDPQRDVDKYVQVADGLGLKIAYAFDTHLHADFVSGARELQALLDLKIGASADAQVAFDHVSLSEGRAIELGDLSIGVLATPGHTPEHISFTMTEAKRSMPSNIFSGGALIVGGAARTDLLGHEHTLPLAQQLYHTIHDKLLKLSDEVVVYPTHGAGSFCNAPVSSERVTTIGQERRTNRFALARSEEEFVREAMIGLPAYPIYYKYMRSINQQGAKILGGVPEPKPWSADEVKQWLEQGGAVLDVRRHKIMQQGFIPNSYCIAVDGPLLVWAGWLIPFGAPLILVASDAAQREAAMRQLIRIGYDDVRGYLDGGFEAWQRKNFLIERMTVAKVNQLHEELRSGAAPIVVDVRHQSEFEAGHLHGARHIHNGDLPTIDLDLPHNRSIAVHCQTQNRSTMAYSILRRRGYENLVLIDGGFSAWEKAGYEIEH